MQISSFNSNKLILINKTMFIHYCSTKIIINYLGTAKIKFIIY